LSGAMQARAILVAVVLSMGCVGVDDARVAPRRPAAAAEPAEAASVARTAPAETAASPMTAEPESNAASAPPPTRNAPPPAGAYDLAQLPVLSKALFYVRENYVDRSRFHFKRMALGALEFVQRDVPEILIDRVPEGDPRQVTVRINGQRQTFAVDRVDAPWRMRSLLQAIFRFVQPNLLPAPAGQEGRRLLDIEIAAVNGMLYTLDPHSVLLDAREYEAMRAPAHPVTDGGLGLVLEMDARDRILVRRALPGSPVAASGILVGDRIVAIDDASTQHMDLDEAIARVRGPLGSRVDLTVERDGSPRAKTYTLERAVVRPTSVDLTARLLSGGASGGAATKVGYLHLLHFASRAADEVKEALGMFERERVKGIILDLRDNHGGLYEQAYKVADAFVESGTVVSMVGVGGTQRKDETASETGQKPKVPVAVLVNHVTASGAEIVAAAMKNLDRGVVIGESTFGSGSVQVLFDIPAPAAASADPHGDKLGLKLTTAQFLGPGDAPIQGVGVVPDIETDALLVRGNGASSSVRLQASRRSRKELDYEWHLPAPSAPAGEKPFAAIAYLGRSDADSEASSYDDNDFVIRLASDLLLGAKGSGRRDVLAGCAAPLARARAGEDRRISAAVSALGVDWTGGPDGPPAELELALQPIGPPKVAAGHTVTVRGVVKNVGSTTQFRVRAVLDSDDPMFDENEMVFGKIAPGESRSYDLSVEVPARAFTRTDLIRATLFTGVRPARAKIAETTLDVEAPRRPVLAYRYQVLDERGRSRRDGRSQAGAEVRIPVTVTNRGPGPAPHLRAILRGRPNQTGIQIRAGRFDKRDLLPGASETFTFLVSVEPDAASPARELTLTLGDEALDEWSTGTVRVPLPADDQPPPAHGQRPAAYEVTPPVLTVSAPTVAAGDTVHVKGRAVDAHLVRDVYIRVWNRNAKMPVRKVFYQSNVPERPGASASMDFEADVPILAGNNLIQIFARQSDDVSTMHTLVVLKRPPAAEPPPAR